MSVKKLLIQIHDTEVGENKSVNKSVKLHLQNVHFTPYFGCVLMVLRHRYILLQSSVYTVTHCSFSTVTSLTERD